MQKFCNFPIYLTCKHVIKICSVHNSWSKYQCTNALSKSVTFSTVRGKRVNSDVNLIRKNTVNVVGDSVIAPVSPPSFTISRRFHSTVVQ